MKAIKYRDDWTFLIDEERTRNFYSKNDLPGLSKLRMQLPEVADFLEQMGIDTRKPLNPKNMDDFDDLLYFAYGKAETTTGYELDFYASEVLLASIVVYCDIDDVERYMWEMPDKGADILLFEIFVNTPDFYGRK